MIIDVESIFPSDEIPGIKTMCHNTSESSEKGIMRLKTENSSGLPWDFKTQFMQNLTPASRRKLHAQTMLKQEEMA